LARRILNRKDLRAANDAAERRLADDEEVVDEEAGDEDEEDEEDEEKGEGDVDAEAEGDDDDEEAPVVAKKKKAAPKVKVVKPKAKPRSRTAKVTRQRVRLGRLQQFQPVRRQLPVSAKSGSGGSRRQVDRR